MRRLNAEIRIFLDLKSGNRMAIPKILTAIFVVLESLADRLWYLICTV
jgi:hypothetical protein